MSGILYLTANDFVLRQGEKGHLMCISQPTSGLCVILFYSNECQHSFNLLSKYKQLPKMINGCQFALININKPSNQSVVQLSQKSISAITFVPDIILYVNGIPYIRYDGIHDTQTIKQFIFDVYHRLQSTMATTPFNPTTTTTRRGVEGQQQPPPPPPNQKPQVLLPSVSSWGHAPTPPPSAPHQINERIKESSSSIPAYCIGRPKCGDERDNVSYLTFSTAYSKPESSSAS